MDDRKIEILNMIQKCPSIIEIFGQQFIYDAIKSYDVIKGNKWSPKNYFLANYLMSVSFYQNQHNYITELEDMFNFFLLNHRDYIKSKCVLSRLTSKDEPLFQGRWSELIFAHFLNRNNVYLIDISKTEHTKNGEIELFDIKTNYGEIEVTTIMSEKGKIFDTNGVISGMLEIDEVEKQLVNKKIKNKSGKKILAIDCTFVDGLYNKLVEIREGLQINFDVFKSTSKMVFLFLRYPATQQVGLYKCL